MHIFYQLHRIPQMLTIDILMSNIRDWTKENQTIKLGIIAQVRDRGEINKGDFSIYLFLSDPWNCLRWFLFILLSLIFPLISNSLIIPQLLNPSHFLFTFVFLLPRISSLKNMQILCSFHQFVFILLTRTFVIVYEIPAMCIHLYLWKSIFHFP